MVQCTQCNQELDEDFGLVTCQNCGAQLLIEMDGQVVDANSQNSNTSQEEVADTPSSPDAFSAVQELTQNMLSELDDNNYEEPAEDSIEEPMSEEFQHEEVGSFDEAQEFVEPESSMPEPENNWDMDEEAVESSEPQSQEPEEPMGFQQTDTAESDDSEPVEQSVVQESWPEEDAKPPENMMQEIQDFANSDESALEQGPLLYDLRIQGIDTRELRGEILEYLNDSRLGLDLENLKIDQGTLIVKSLNPVVVSVIAQRLKPLPIVLDWRQHAAFS